MQSTANVLNPDAVREAFRRRRGHWNDDWEAMLAYSPDYVAAYLEFSAYVADRGTLSPKFRELIYVATNCTPTHMFEKGLRNHARQALTLGATPAELLSVVATVSAIGIYSHLLISQSIVDLVPNASARANPSDMNRARADHAALFGKVLAEADPAIACDPHFYSRWLDFAAAPIRGPHAALSLKDAHLVALAVHAQCTQLNPAGIRLHAGAAITHGATIDEVLDIGRLISSMGIHAMVFALPIITELAGEIEGNEHGRLP
ncbi:carboxymuconolactone decarboxylase family protein [Xanthobacter autotrophicus]|uniref:carboxymuconolactone decarboxylase family protein n=1 Tax=Xanthobacter autotrophicus TaxID=280 RepID=UPI0024A63F95|nr:carboxymuconolactone decarboxylase family protein [Xanthobacter autotrophicus]MDI4655316.1 carboxymuconolactone decarboxylase family protein [Xanthobacter autotrophicus]